MNCSFVFRVGGWHVHIRRVPDLELDDAEHVDAFERHSRFDAREVAREHGGGVGVEEPAPVGVVALGRGRDPATHDHPRSKPPGTKQLTVSGWPVYTYTGDTAAGQANGQRLNVNGGTWWAVTTSGALASASALPGGPSSSFTAATH